MFEPSNEPIKNFKATFRLKEGTKPVFLKATSPPFAIRDEIARQLKELEGKGIVKYVGHSDWASKLVVAPKKNGQLRLCVNYRTTLNQHLQDNHYPLPVIDDILCTLGGDSCFVSLDLQGAYHQLLLDEESQLMTTVNTHLGLYQYLRLPFGVKPAPAIFQGVMEQILNGLLGVQVYLDDILIGGASLDQCYERLTRVLDRLKEFNVHVNFDKCKFFTDNLEFLGHRITRDGIAPSTSKMTALLNAPPPQDITQLRSFIGGVNYYGKFVPNLQSMLHPLYKLLQKGVKFDWSVECDKCFQTVKKSLENSTILARYDPTKPLTIVCDASPYGVGAILNVIEDGVERPCFMASTSLNQAERNYSQLHREAFAVVFALSKYHKFVYGHKVIIYTDCKALESLLSNQRNLDGVINSRFLRWLLFLQNYDIEVKFRPSKQTACADVLSRLPLPEESGVVEEELHSLILGVVSDVRDLNISRENIENEMSRDATASEVMEYVVNGWPGDSRKSLAHLSKFYSVKEALDVDANLLYYGDRVYIPVKLRELVLKKIHDQHVGVIRCKQLARQYVWWPGINADIDAFVRRCDTCQQCGDRKSQHPLMSWPKATYPFERIHLDHFFFENFKFLIIVDAFSGWIHVDFNKFIDTNCVLLSLRKFFATFGLPASIVTDNGTAFISSLFKRFCEVNGIVHKTAPQYHPQSNGLAERSVGVVKSNLKKFLCDRKVTGFNLDEQIQNFLFNQHHTPNAEGIIPAEKLLNFRTKVFFSQFQKRQTTVEDQHSWSRSRTRERSQERSKRFQATGSSLKSNEVNKSVNQKNNFSKKQNVLNKKKHEVKAFKTNDLVYVYWPRALTKFVDGIILARLSPLTYKVRLTGGHELKVHRDSLKPRQAKPVFSSFSYRSFNSDVPDGRPQTQVSIARRSFVPNAVPQGGSPSMVNDGASTSRGQPRILRRKPRVDYKKFL